MSVIEVSNIDWKKRLVRSNEFTGALYSLLPDAHRIVSVAVSVINKDDLDFTTCRIFTKKLIEYYPSLRNDKNAIARLDEATDSLMWSFVKIELKDGWIKRNLVESCQFTKNKWNPYIDIKLSDDMLPHFISVTSKFSSPRMANTQLLKKDHHFKLHGFFHSLSYKKEPTIVSFEELRNIFNIDKKQYKLIGHFKSRLLLPTIDYINKVTDLSVECFDEKEGRRIVGFKFIVHVIEAKLPKENNTQHLWKINKIEPVSSNRNVNQNNVIENNKLVEWWIKKEEVNKLIQQHWQTYIDQLIIYITHKSNIEKIESIKGYIFWVLKNQPTMEQLKTANCVTKETQIKRQKHTDLEKKVQKRTEEKSSEQLKLQQQQAKAYLKQLNDNEYKQLKQNFTDSKAAGGLKFGANTIDFNKPVVLAVFEAYVYSTYLDK